MMGFTQTRYLCGVISCGERLSKDFFHKLKACLFSCSNNNITIMIHLSRWDHLPNKGYDTFKMIALHWVVDTQHDCSSDCFQIFNSIAELGSANVSEVSNW